VVKLFVLFRVLALNRHRWNPHPNQFPRRHSLTVGPTIHRGLAGDTLARDDERRRGRFTSPQNARVTLLDAKTIALITS
jgi:hypothetical protein